MARKKDETEIGITGKPIPRRRLSPKNRYELEKKRRQNLGRNVGCKTYYSDVNQNYKVLTTDYIASGGDDAVGFAQPIAKSILGLKVRDALLKEVKELQAQGKTINAKLDGRITKN
jgi:hypothetical protein